MTENEWMLDAPLIPELRSLLALWRSRREPDRCPRLPDVTPGIDDSWLAHTAVVMRMPTQGFVIATCGYALIRRFGRMAAGAPVSTLARGIGHELDSRLLETLCDRQAVVWCPVIALGRARARFSEVILPLSIDGKRIDLFLLAAFEQR